MGGVCISVILKDGVERVRQGKFPQSAESNGLLGPPHIGEKKKAKGENYIYGYLNRGQRPS